MGAMWFGVGFARCVVVVVGLSEQKGGIAMTCWVQDGAKSWDGQLLGSHRTSEQRLIYTLTYIVFLQV